MSDLRSLLAPLLQQLEAGILTASQYAQISAGLMTQQPQPAAAGSDM
jgi:hypothetical protein